MPATIPEIHPQFLPMYIICNPLHHSSIAFLCLTSSFPQQKQKDLGKLTKNDSSVFKNQTAETFRFSKATLRPYWFGILENRKPKFY